MVRNTLRVRERDARECIMMETEGFSEIISFSLSLCVVLHRLSKVIIWRQ